MPEATNGQKHPTGTRGAALVRVSGAPGQEHTRQEQEITRWLDLYGLEVQHWYRDTGSRDLGEKRQVFQRMLREVEEGRWDWVIVESLDRLGVKDAVDFFALLAKFRAAGCELWDVGRGNLLAPGITPKLLGLLGAEQSKDEQVEKSGRTLGGTIVIAQEGKWLGGTPPWGYDVEVYRNGVPTYRIHWEGLFRRVKVYADGRQERYDGEDNVPARDRDDVARIVPSMDGKRQEAIRLLFDWFANEAITPGMIARRLTALGHKFISGPWYANAVRKVLENGECYLTGRQVYNKISHGRFKQFKEGRLQEVEQRKGRAVPPRRMGDEDRVRAKANPAHPGIGLITEGTWDLVRAKLARKGKNRAPKSGKLWCSSMLYCGKCGGRMVAFTARGTYVCGSFRKFGKGNEFGCGMHKVRHDELEELLGQYLTEADEKLDLLLGTGDYVGVNAEPVLRALQLEKWEKAREYLRSLEGMRALVEACSPTSGGQTTIEVDGVEYDTVDVRKEYKTLQAARAEGVRAEIAQRQELLEGLARNIGKLRSQIALEAAEGQIDALGKEIEALQAQLVDLGDRSDTLLKELRQAQERIREAREACRGDLAQTVGRRRAEQVGRCLSRIVVNHDDDGEWSSATFYPIDEGDGEEFVRDDTHGSLVSVANILRRTVRVRSRSGAA